MADLLKLGALILGGGAIAAWWLRRNANPTPPDVAWGQVPTTANTGHSLAALVHAQGLVNADTAITSKLAPGCLSNPPPGFTWDDGKRKFRPIGPGELPIKRRGTSCVKESDIDRNDHGVPTMMVGPFAIPLTDSHGKPTPHYSFVFTDPNSINRSMPKEWLGAIQLAFNPNAQGKDNANPQTVKPATCAPNALGMMPCQPDVATWLAALGVQQPIDMNVIAAPKSFSGSWWDLIPLGPFGVVGIYDAIYQGVTNIGDLTGPPEPFAKFTNPKTGEDWGGWIKIRAKTTSKGIALPTMLEIYFGKIPDSPWYQDLLNDLFTPFVWVGQGAKAVAEGAAALVCAISKNPAASAAVGSAIGGAEAGPAGAKTGAAAGVGAGAAVAAACNAGTPPPMLVQQAQQNWGIPLLVAGGVVFALAVANKRKQHPAPTAAVP